MKNEIIEGWIIKNDYPQKIEIKENDFFQNFNGKVYASKEACVLDIITYDGYSEHVINENFK